MAKDKKSKARAVKARVLQARIPEQLDDELKGYAEQLGTSVSTVVRNILLNTFDLVEGVVSDSANLARVIHDRRALAEHSEREEAVPADDSSNDMDASGAECIGWQPMVLNQNGVCDSCNAILPRGTQAAVGVPVQARPVFMCNQCLEGLSSGE